MSFHSCSLALNLVLLQLFFSSPTVTSGAGVLGNDFCHSMIFSISLAVIARLAFRHGRNLAFAVLVSMLHTVKSVYGPLLYPNICGEQQKVKCHPVKS